MNRDIEKLEKQFLLQDRYNNFGEILLGLTIKGIKGTNCSISFDFPITAIAGYNGAGKSTIAQIALCMYKAPDENNKMDRKYLKNFFVKTLLDKSPYAKDAKIVARYASKQSSEPIQISILPEDQEQENTKSIDVYYAGDRWEGYRYQPQRMVHYYGMSLFIPYQELTSNLLRDGTASLTQSVPFDDKTVAIVSDILSIRYRSLHSNSISNEKRTESVFSAEKPSATYSENHMGCGEGRLLKLVYSLENAPNKSLFVIEEPETALHELAQHKFGMYLLDVCERKKHQIIFTTHSPEIMSAIPPQGRKYIQRDVDGQTLVENSPTVAQIRNHLSGGHFKKMTIVAEDTIAALYIKEILRAYAPSIFDNCDFFPMDLGYSEVKDFVVKAQKCKMKVFGIVDEQRRGDLKNHSIGFPEEDPPEKVFLSNDSIKQLVKTEFGFDCQDLTGDHHSFFEQIAKKRDNEMDYVVNRCIKEFVRIKGKDYYKTIIEAMNQWLSECK